jgi:hypothetical protein
MIVVLEDTGDGCDPTKRAERECSDDRQSHDPSPRTMHVHMPPVGSS